MQITLRAPSQDLREFSLGHATYPIVDGICTVELPDTPPEPGGTAEDAARAVQVRAHLKELRRHGFVDAAILPAAAPPVATPEESEAH